MKKIITVMSCRSTSSKSLRDCCVYTITKALKGQKQQHRATPCDWTTVPFQALKGRDQASFQITSFQGSNSRVCPSHWAASDAIAERLSDLTTLQMVYFSTLYSKK